MLFFKEQIVSFWMGLKIKGLKLLNIKKVNKYLFRMKRI